MKQVRNDQRAGTAVGKVRAGALYRARLPDGTVETVLVHSVREDLTGIVHVRFDLFKDRPQMLRRRVGPRILSLSAFRQRYREEVSLPGSLAAE